MADPGWYPDATNEGWLAYWDGQRWTGDRHPPQVQPQQESPLPADPQQTWQPPAEQDWRPPASAQPAQPQQAAQPAASSTPGQSPFEQTTRLSDLRAEPQQPVGWHQPTEQWAAPPVPPQQSPQWQSPPPAYAEQQQNWQQPYPGQPYGEPPQNWQPPLPAKRSRKKLIIAGAAVVVVAAGVLTWILLPSGGPTLTYNGKSITSADKVLSTAEGQLASVVKQRHGATNSDTRCYFAKPKKQPSGKKSTDVQNSLRCGPVLFVDGSRSRPYLAVPLHSSTSGGSAELTTSAPTFASTQPQALPGNVTLARPDGASAPTGSGGLSVPKPPAAVPNVLTATTLGPTPPPAALDKAVMTGRSSKVTVTAAGVIDRFGRGDTARTAPSGQQLIAFQVDYGAGDVDLGGPHATLAVTGQAARPVPDTTDADHWVVAAVPTSGSAKLVLTDGGYAQSLSLPAGKPGAANLAVLTRQHRTSLLFKSFDVPLHLTKPGASGDVTFHARTSVASLDFWVPRHTGQHASSPNKAILSVGLTYTDTKDPGKIFGFDPHLVTLRLPNGHIVHSKNVAAAGKVDDVFEVPAGFTRGRVQVSGTYNTGGVHVRVSRPKSFAVSIAAG